MRKHSVATVLVESNNLLREALARILNTAHFNIIASASSLDPVVLTSLRRHQSSLLVVGASNDPDETVKQIKLFKELNQTGYVAVLAERVRLGDILSIFRAGANACVTKITTCEALVKSLELVVLGETILPREFLPVLLGNEDAAFERDIGAHATELAQMASKDMPRLSAQEKRILRCLIDGDPNKIIARKVDIAEATVKVHVKAILRKIRLHNRTQAAVWAMSHGQLMSDAIDGFDEAASKQPLDGNVVSAFLATRTPVNGSNSMLSEKR